MFEMNNRFSASVRSSRPREAEGCCLRHFRIRLLTSPSRTTLSPVMAGLVLAIAFSVGQSAEQRGERPNILWLVSEDNDTYLGCYGDKLARTPTLDKLASEGIVFERCFAQPVCAPSRFTLITGMYAAGHGPAEHMRAQGKIPAWLRG